VSTRAQETSGIVDHPQGDPKLPSYVHPALKDVASDLAMVGDCWNLLRGVRGKYLPREVAEPPKAYEGRLARAKFPAFLRDGIQAFSGALSRFEVSAAPPTFEAALSNIDGEGQSLKSLLMRADLAAMRDGGCLLMVDMPPGRAESRADELALGRRPLLRFAERMMVRNWKVEREGGIEIPVAVTVLEWHEVEDGDFGITMEPRYRVMRGGKWSLVRINGASGNGKGSLAWQVEEVTNGVFEDAAGNPLRYPPVCWYSVSREGFGRGDLPFYALAEGSLDWFREYSDYKELLRKTAMPVAVRKGAPMGPNGVPAPLAIGPNSVVDLPEGGSFEWAEVSGSSLERHEANLAQIEALIDRQTLSFLFGGSGDRTATHAELESAQLQATLTAIGEQKASMMQTVMELWVSFTGERLGPGAGLVMAKGVVDRPVDPETLRLAKDLYDAGLLRRASVTALEGRAGLLPQGVTPEAEALALEIEDELLNGETPGPADPAVTGENDGENQDQQTE
jgi:hypothetical protein